MSEKNKELLSLDLASYNVFSPVDAQPVAILNEASSQLCRLHYCAGIASNLSMIAELCANHDSHDVQWLAGVFSNQFEPLSSMLDRLVLDATTLGRA